MFSSVRRRLSYANVVATFALVFAMSGGALAASKYLITSSKQVKPSVLASLKGKAGAAGANGAQGPAGPGGPMGPAGATGPQGPAGAAGAKGETGLEGKEGKAGKEGKTGVAGSPWTVGGTLPSGKTETGTWAFGPLGSEGTAGTASVPVASFPIPLEASLGAGHAHFINVSGKEINENEEEVTSSVCLGKASEPTAQPGNLCVYATLLNNASTTSAQIADPVNPGGIGTVGRTGAIESFGTPTPGTERGIGTWAVTAESE